MTTPVDAKQLALATNALLAFIHGENQANNNLLEDDGFISLVVTLARTPEKGRTKPFYAPLTHSLYKDRPVCLITCDGLYKTVKEHLKTHPVEGVEKVLSITKLRKEFGRYEAKRKLSDSYDLFLADARLLHLLPQLIGAKFFDKKKHPSIIDLSKADVTSSLIKGRDATYFHLRAGPTLMVKIARTSFSDKQIIENFNAAIGAIVEQIPKKWKGVQALYLRTAASIALPFYNSLPFSLKLQDSDTPQLALPSKGKRKADSDEKETSTKKRAITSLPSSAPFSTLTITGIKPEAEETLEEEADDSDSPSSPQAKRKAVATPRAPPAAPAAATPKPVSTKKKQKVGVTPKAAPATPVAQPVAVSTPAKPGTQKKKKAGTPAQSAVPSTPVVSATPKTSLKKKKTAPTPAVQPAAPATPQAPVVSATPKPSLKKMKVGATPKVVQAAPATPQATVAATPKPSLKKAKVGATPKVAQAVPATPAAAVIPAQSTKKPKVATTPKVVDATPTVKASTIKKKKAPAS